MVLELEISKQELRDKNKVFSENAEVLTDKLAKFESALHRANSDLEKFKQSEQEGLFISQKQKENLEINQKLVEELKQAKIQNIKLKKAFTQMNNKLVDTVAEKVVL